MARDIVSGIVETANALGMDPLDLATIISYETGGTFNPTQPGPTTKWGQHRGLIQWGQPQAEQYGVDWNDPAGSQLGADGAIVRYYVDRGWQPGMGIEDAYSIVNAGAPGRYDASDEAAGGAPGTVRDKVGTFGPHRERAQAMLGGGEGVPAGTAQDGQRYAHHAGPHNAPDEKTPAEVANVYTTRNLGFPVPKRKGGERDELQEELEAFYLAQRQKREKRKRNLGFA